jgi:hypothetical protein
MRLVYEAAGGADGVLRLADAWHARVTADEVVSHAFSHGFHPEHSRRLAAYWAEALGGSTTYSDGCVGSRGPVSESVGTRGRGRVGETGESRQEQRGLQRVVAPVGGSLALDRRAGTTGHRGEAGVGGGVPTVGNAEPSPAIVRILRAVLNPLPGIEVRTSARGWASRCLEFGGACLAFGADVAQLRSHSGDDDAAERGGAGNDGGLRCERFARILVGIVLAGRGDLGRMILVMPCSPRPRSACGVGAATIRSSTPPRSRRGPTRRSRAGWTCSRASRSRLVSRVDWAAREIDQRNPRHPKGER